MKNEDVKQLPNYILHERMKTKAALERLRLAEMTDIKKSYSKEINKCLDYLNQLDEMYEKFNKK
jgi:hypothetical protein